MHPVCSGCAAPCCVGRDVPVGEDEVAALASMLGVPTHAFAVDGEAGARLRRRDGDGACMFAVAVGGSYRCGVEGEAKPRACRVYPYHVAVDEAGAWTAAYGNDAVCPLPRDAAWAARLDEERPTIDAAVRAATGTSARRLPVVGDSPCFGCTTTCCLDYVVPVNAHDVWRLARALGLSWGALVEVRPTPADYMESFTLDSSGQKRAFQLRRRAGGACALLTSLPDGSHRCGVHAARPLACRLYPYRGDWTPGAPIRVVADAVCPPERRDRYEARKVFAASDVVAEVGERHLYMRALDRWDQAARTRPPSQAYGVDDFVRWAFALYDAVEALRREGPIGFAPAAALIAGFPLPDDSAPGC